VTQGRSLGRVVHRRGRAGLLLVHVVVVAPLGRVVDTGGRRRIGLLLVDVVVAPPLAAVLLLVEAHQLPGERGLHLPTKAPVRKQGVSVVWFPVGSRRS